MKALIKSGCLGLLALLFPALSRAELSPPKTLLGKFLVSTVNGTATCVSEGRIFELKKGDTVTARGSTVETVGKSNVILVFSNGTGVYVDSATRLEVVKFDQEYFAPNNNLRVEPSNSSTVVKMKTGRVVVSTPRLLSGTTMFYETPHVAVGIRGDKLLIEANERQTHVAMISGQATVNPRNSEGQFVSIGKRLVTGQEAFIKYTAGGPELVESSPPAEVAPLPSAPPPREAPAVWATTETEAIVVQLTGPAQAKPPDGRPARTIALGDTLPRGTVITTDASAEVCLQLFPGTIATLQPATQVEISGLSLTTNRGTATRQSTLLNLRTGTLVSAVDPATHALNNYAVRTTHGTATAEGTSFVASLQPDAFSLATTADSVTFVTLAGTPYTIAAGQVYVALPGGGAQPPLPLAAAIAGNPQVGAAVRAGFAAVANAVERHVGGLSAASATNLLARVAGTASATLPGEAVDLVTRAIRAATSPAAPTSQQPAATIGAITQAVVAAAPAEAAPIAVAALHAAQAHDTIVGAAAAKASPSQSAAIAAAVCRALFEVDRATPARVQALAAVAAAITSSNASQAAPVASAAMEVIIASATRATPVELAQHAGLLAATITAAAPAQAVPIASALMKLLLQHLTDATPQAVAQVGSLLAGPIITVVPAQAQEVATAVMQLMVQEFPNVTPAWIADTAGLFAATLVQVRPVQAGAIIAGVAAGSGLSVAELEQGIARFAGLAGQWAAQIQQVNQFALAAFQRGAGAPALLAAAHAMVQPPGVNGAAFGTTPGRNGGTSITIGDNADGGHSTSIVISQFDPGLINQLTADLEAAQAAQTSVQFSVDTTSNRGNTVRPEPVVPGTLPSEFVVSPAR